MFGLRVLGFAVLRGFMGLCLGFEVFHYFRFPFNDLVFICFWGICLSLE